MVVEWNGCGCIIAVGIIWGSICTEICSISIGISVCSISIGISIGVVVISWSCIVFIGCVCRIVVAIRWKCCGRVGLVIYFYIVRVTYSVCLIGLDIIVICVITYLLLLLLLLAADILGILQWESITISFIIIILHQYLLAQLYNRTSFVKLLIYSVNLLHHSLLIYYFILSLRHC